MRDTPSPGLAVLVAALVLLLFAPAVYAPSARADEEPEADEAEASPPLTPEEARRLEKALSRAAKRRKQADILPVLDEVGERSHPDFVKPLLKMLKHQAADVALRACEVLEFQKTESEKDEKKLVKGLWKAFGDRANKRRHHVQGRILQVIGTRSGEPVDERAFREIEGLWRKMTGDPQETWAVGIEAVCAYVRSTKDKRLCRMLAENIDEPMATAVNSPTNPPREWWERRWKMWKITKAVCVETLEDLTGQSFKDMASAKAWFEANEKEFGFEW